MMLLHAQLTLMSICKMLRVLLKAQGFKMVYPSLVRSLQMETDAKVEDPKKKVKKMEIPVVEFVHGGMLPGDLQKAVEKEVEMALQDQDMEETKDRKNVLEVYVYDIRNKLYEKYPDFVPPLEKEQVNAKLQEVEYWLYEEGDDET